MRGLKNRLFRLGFGFRVGIVLLGLLLIGFAVFQFPASASKKKNPMAQTFHPKDLLAISDFNLKTKSAAADFNLQAAGGEFSTPQLTDYHTATDSLLISSGQPAKLELFSKTLRREFISNQFFAGQNTGEPQSMAAVRDQNGRFAPGEVFLGFARGTIFRFSPDGSQVTEIDLPREKSGIDGGLIVDRTNVFGGDLIAATATGRIWRVDASGGKNLFLDLNTEIKGLTILPNDFVRYGAMAGKMIVGAVRQRGIYAIDASGQFMFFPLDIKAQDIELIEPNSDLFAVSAERGKLFRLDAQNLANRTGDILIASAETKEFYALHFTGTQFQVSTFTTNENIDRMTFAPLKFEDTGGGCVTALVQPENAFQWDGEAGSFNVFAPSNCNWTAVSNASWLTVISGQNGTGNGTVQYTVTKNQTNVLRDANITVDSLTHRVRQSKKASLQCSGGAPAGNQNIGAIGGSGTISIAGNSNCAWQAGSDSPWLTLTGNIYGAGSGTVSFTVATNFTAQTRQARVSFAGGTATVTQAPNLAPAINAGADQIIALPNTANLSASATDDGIGNPVTVSWSKLNGAETVLFSAANNLNKNAIFSKEGVYVLRLTVSDGYLTATDDVQITVNADPTPPPPNPVTTAPPINPTIATNTADATEFLYTGPNPIQKDVKPEDINKVRAGVLRGRVRNKDGSPLSKVRVSVMDHPELGWTETRADGMFDLVINAGGKVVVKYEKTGFISSERDEVVQWQEYRPMDDVVLIPYDDNVTEINLNAAIPIQVAAGGMSSDDSGTRRSRLFFKQGTLAMVTLPNGSLQTISEMHVRGTEFTTGDNGFATMPGALPATSAYTYAVEYSADEAVALNATSVMFNHPVIQYNENFLSFPVGTVIPSGSYNRETGIWESSANGRIVKLLSVTNGFADLDLDGSGIPADDAAYAALDINPAERQTLAELYAVNQSLWRVPLIHFTPWDSNWPFGPPADAVPPQAPPVKKKDCDCDEEGGGNGISQTGYQKEITEQQNPSGGPWPIHHNSDRQEGYKDDNKFEVELSGIALPASLKRIDMEVTVGGRTFLQSFPNTPNQHTTFTWDGMDAYGRPLQGDQPAQVRLGYVYDGVYQQTEVFGYNGNGIPITGDAARREVSLNQIQNTSLNKFNTPKDDFGGWTLAIHHVYNPAAHVLNQGDGITRGIEATGFSSSIGREAGQLLGTGYSGDGGLATSALLKNPYGLTIAADGTKYILDQGGTRLRRITPAGIINTIAGNGTAGGGGDGGPAVNAELIASNVKIGIDGSIYLSKYGLDPKKISTVRRIDANGIITTVAGGGTDSTGEGIPATAARLNSSVCFPAPDGTLYIISDYLHIRRVGTDGLIRTIAGGGQDTGEGAIALNALIQPTDLAVAPNGDLYFIDTFASGLTPLNRIRRLSTDGRLYTVAGGGDSQEDGIPANLAALDLGSSALDHLGSNSLAFGPDGTFYFLDGSPVGAKSNPMRRLRSVTPQGIITTVAGNGEYGLNPDGVPARQTTLGDLRGIVVTPNNEVQFVENFPSFVPGEEPLAAHLRSVKPAFPTFGLNESRIASPDGRQVFIFAPSGRHLATLNSMTGAPIYTFGYDPAGRLSTVTDGDGNLTTINRNAGGRPTSLVNAFGQTTTYEFDSNGYLSKITNPNNESYQYVYDANGLITSKKDPRNNITQYTYNSTGRLIQETAPNNSSETLTRTDNNSQDFTVARNTGAGRQFTYQVQNLPANEQKLINTDPNGLQTETLIRKDGITEYRTPDGVNSVTTFGGDSRWGLQSPTISSNTTSTPGGLTFNVSTQQTTDLSNPNDPLSLISQNNVLSVNDKTYTLLYTAANKTLTKSSPLGKRVTSVIDPQGRNIEQKVGNLNTSFFTYNNRGSISSITQGQAAEARTMSYTYNSNGFLSSVTNPLNQTYGLIYDQKGRVTRETLTDNSFYDFGFDSKGDLTSVTPPGRTAHTFTYDSLDQLISYTAPNVGGSSQTTYEYNVDNQLTKITRPDGLQQNYTYNAAGLLQTLTLPNGTYIYSYNKTTGNYAAITAPGGIATSFDFDGPLLTKTTWSGSVSGNVSHIYDGFFRLSSQNINDGNTVDFTYDDDNHLTGVGALTLTRDPQNGLVSGSSLGSISGTTTYNGFAEPISDNVKFGVNSIFDVERTYDKLGRLTQKTEQIGGTTTIYGYAYNLSGQLASVTLNGGTEPLATYTYDANGNRTSSSLGGIVTNAAFDAQDRLTQYGNTTYTYTANGELQSKTLAGQTTQYNYDVIGNLRNVTLPGGTQIEYLIDGSDRRVGKKINGTLTQGFLYQNKLAPVAELDGANNIVSLFAYGTKTNVPEYMIRGGNTYRLITDKLGSVRLVADITSGNIAQRIDYDEFGNVLTDTNPGFQPFGFAGGLYDPQTGLVRFGARDYDAETGRWTAKDPILFAADSNLYRYVLNDPVNLSDPFGLNEWQKFKEDPMGYLDNKISQIPESLIPKSLETAKKAYDTAKDIATIESRYLTEQITKNLIDPFFNNQLIPALNNKIDGILNPNKNPNKNTDTDPKPDPKKEDNSPCPPKSKNKKKKKIDQPPPPGGPLTTIHGPVPPETWHVDVWNGSQYQSVDFVDGKRVN
jgi:RHS repeat-associated protein